MQQAEYNHEDFREGSPEADKSLLVRFFYKNVENKMASKQQNRPVYKEKTYIEIRVAGQRDVAACRPATHQDLQRFPKHFEAFEKRVEPPTEGMPLAEWPQITRSQVEELSFVHVKTVEQLAALKDANAQKMMNGYSIREKAQKWLLVNDELKDDKEKEELKAEVAELKRMVAELMEVKVADKPTLSQEDMVALRPKDAAPVETLGSTLDSETVQTKPASRRKARAKPKTTEE